MMRTILIHKMVIFQANYFGGCPYKQGKGFYPKELCEIGIVERTFRIRSMFKRSRGF